MKPLTLIYGKTNNYLIPCNEGYLLIDTGLKGSFDAFKESLLKYKITISEIKYVFITHYHADHHGTLDKLIAEGVKLLFTVEQQKYGKVDKYISAGEGIELIGDGRDVLKNIGIDGMVIHTPGHTKDSVSLLTENQLFAGDLIKLSELKRANAESKKSWKKIMDYRPEQIFYGHGSPEVVAEINSKQESSEKYALVKKIMSLIDKGTSIDKISYKTGADIVFVEDVSRMYLTHQNVGVQGILDRIEIKGR